MSRPNMALNQEHLDNPVAGDYWHEMFCIYHIVLKVLENGNLIIAKRDLAITNGQWFDFKNAYEITKEEHSGIVRYKGLDGFVADVVVGHTLVAKALEEWVSNFGGRYQTLDTRLNPPKVVTETDIQDIIYLAMVEALGFKFKDIDSFLNSIPLENRLPDYTSRQATIHHAVARAFGFDSLQDMVEAKGLFLYWPDLPTAAKAVKE